MLLRRTPLPALRPFVAELWASDDTDPAKARAVERERVLPTGAMHLVFRLSPEPLRLFDDEDARCVRVVGHATVGGARAACYVRDVSSGSRSVGALLRAGAGQLLFGASAAELAGKHTPLDELWGHSAELARQRLLEAQTLERQLDQFEALLLERLPRVRGLHPAIAQALAKFGDAPSVHSMVAESGYSHRRFIALFEAAVGLTPKRYARVIRFQSVLARMSAAPTIPLVELAFTAGYCDQAHFNREFREIAGISPRQYRAAQPLQSHHVPVVPARR